MLSSQMRVPLCRGGLSRLTWHRARAWWDDDSCGGMARRDLGVDIVPVVGAIAGKGRHGTIDLFEQGADLRAVIGVPVGQHRGDDVADVSVGGEVTTGSGFCSELVVAC